jgi:hypothetical protein
MQLFRGKWIARSLKWIARSLKGFGIAFDPFILSTIPLWG